MKLTHKQYEVLYSFICDAYNEASEERQSIITKLDMIEDHRSFEYMQLVDDLNDCVSLVTLLHQMMTNLDSIEV